MSNKLERLLSNYEAGRDDEIGELWLELRARVVARQWVLKPESAERLSRVRRELLDEALETAFLSWGYRR